MKVGIQRADTYTEENGNTKEDAKTKAAHISGLAESRICLARVPGSRWKQNNAIY